MGPSGNDWNFTGASDERASEPHRSAGRTAALRAATSAAAFVAVCGAFYIGTVFSGGHEPAKPATNPKPAVVAETTGSATAQDAPEVPSVQASSDASAAADCQEQTWPYIARPCLANEKGVRGVRVISIDKLADPVIGVVQTPPDAVTNRRVVAPEPAKAPAVPQAAVVSNNNSKQPATEPAALKSGAALGTIAISETAKPAAAEHADAAPAVAAQTTAQAASPARDAALEKSKRKTAKRQEAERLKTATAQSDDDEVALAPRGGKLKGRIVERWTERSYTVPAYEGNGTRRVIVTGRDSSSVARSAYTSERSVSDRGGFPNIFGAIFGGGD